MSHYRPMRLSAENIVLRGLESLEDAELLFARYCSSKEASLYLQRGPRSGVEQTYNMLKDWCEKRWSEQGCSFGWIISQIADNSAIGVFLAVIENDKAEIHFGIGVDYWGKGYVRESLSVVVSFLLERLGLGEVWALCDFENKRCASVLEKAGFSVSNILKGHLSLPMFPDEFRDCMRYSKRAPHR